MPKSDEEILAILKDNKTRLINTLLRENKRHKDKYEKLVEGLRNEVERGWMAWNKHDGFWGAVCATKTICESTYADNAVEVEIRPITKKKGVKK